jgi:hypothetical protein
MAHFFLQYRDILYSIENSYCTSLVHLHREHAQCFVRAGLIAGVEVTMSSRPTSLVQTCPVARVQVCSVKRYTRRGTGTIWNGKAAVIPERRARVQVGSVKCHTRRRAGAVWNEKKQLLFWYEDRSGRPVWSRHVQWRAFRCAPSNATPGGELGQSGTEKAAVILERRSQQRTIQVQARPVARVQV